MESQDQLKKTPLFALHQDLGGKLVPFAGYSMPVQYPLGIMKEHLHTREKAGLFDVSHMGQALLKGKSDQDVGEIFEKIVPGNIQALKPGRLRYTLLLNDEGGILDDLMATRLEGRDNTLYLVVNAACKDQDFKYIQEKISDEAELEILDDRALLALQGPRAEAVLGKLWKGAEDLKFMQGTGAKLDGIECQVSRSGYTGEDGFEISVPADKAQNLAEKLLDHEDVEAIGLGARDSLRLEAGLCLYGHDIDDKTTPVEADLVWAIGKKRRETGDFPGGKKIVDQIKNGVSRKRVGIQPKGRAPAREGTEIVDRETNKVGQVTSGGFGPSAGGPVAMGYVKTEFADPGTEIGLEVRGKTLPAKVVSMPFVSHKYKR